MRFSADATTVMNGSGCKGKYPSRARKSTPQFQRLRFTFLRHQDRRCRPSVAAPSGLWSTRQKPERSSQGRKRRSRHGLCPFQIVVVVCDHDFRSDRAPFAPSAAHTRKTANRITNLD